MNDEKNIIRNIDEPITKKEKQDLTEEFLKLDYQYDVTDAAQKRSKKQFDAQKDELEGKIKSIKDTMRTGKITRQVECRVEYLPDKGQKDIIRIDKGEVLSTETMTRKDYDDYQEMSQLNAFPEDEQEGDDNLVEKGRGDDMIVHVGMILRKEDEGFPSDDDEAKYEYASIISVGEDAEDGDPMVHLEGRDGFEKLSDLLKVGWEIDPDFIPENK